VKAKKKKKMRTEIVWYQSSLLHASYLPFELHSYIPGRI